MTTNTNLVSYFNLFFLFISIIWVPVQLCYLHIDGAGRTLWILSSVAILLNLSTFRKRKSLFSGPFLLWTLLVVYTFVNSISKGYVAEWGFVQHLWSNFLNPFVFLVIAIIALDYNKDQCLKLVLIAQLVYLIIGGGTITIHEFDRSVSEELGNALPLTACGCAFVACYLFNSRALKGGWVSFIIIMALVLSIIIISATRKAFGAVLLVLIGMLLGRSRGTSAGSVLGIVLISFIMVLGIRYIINGTFIGERFTESDDSYYVAFSSNTWINNFLMKLLGNRAPQYLMGFMMFKLHPITGIGLCNYMSVSNDQYRLHTEYMVQLCENGIIGFVLLLFFYIILSTHLNKSRSSRNYVLCLFGLLMVLFLNFTTWTYNMQIVMLVYAILITEPHLNLNNQICGDTIFQNKLNF